MTLSFLQHSPLLLLFLVAATGVLLGRVKVRGFSLGVAAVLFVGLGAGAFDAALGLPELVLQFGLALFVYTIGLGSGAGFFAALRRRGARDGALVLGALGLAMVLTLALGRVLGLGGPATAGLYAGALTNTPALAGVVEWLAASGADARAQTAPVVAYSLAYPTSVLAVLLALAVAKRRSEHEVDAPLSRRWASLVAEPLVNRTVLLDKTPERSAEALAHDERWEVVFGRMQRGDRIELVTPETQLRAGDRVSILGRGVDVQAATQALGSPSDIRLDLDRSVIDFRRMIVSKRDVCGVPLRELALPKRFGAIVTRIGRGDVDLLAESETELELGDRVRVVAPRERLAEVSKALGDSYREAAEIDVLTFGVGIALGLVLGAIPVPLFGGGSFKLGFAGGPLIVGLILGRLGRTGPFVWSMPYSANLTLRQLGLVLFLAAVGTRSGHALRETLAAGEGLGALVGGGVIAAVSAATVLFVGRRAKIPVDVLAGMVAGIQTQPAALAFANGQAKSELPNLGYATVFPLAMIAKIILAQVVVVLAR